MEAPEYETHDAVHAVQPSGHKLESEGGDYKNGYKNFVFLYMPQDLESISLPLESQLGYVTDLGQRITSKHDTSSVLRDT